MLEKIRRVAGQFGQRGVQRAGLDGAALRLDDLERRALELNR